MLRGLGRAFWWVVVYERPTSAGDYAAMLGLLLLLGLGALALSWPWVSTELPRTLAAGRGVPALRAEQSRRSSVPPLRAGRRAIPGVGARGLCLRGRHTDRDPPPEVPPRPLRGVLPGPGPGRVPGPPADRGRPAPA